jgi:signal peptidase I
MTAASDAPQDRTPGVPPRGVLREYLETILVCVLVLVFARTYVFMQSKIPTPSMVSTLLVGDYILVDNNIYGAAGDTPRAWLGQREVRRGDVVVFRFPEDPDTDYVKRVVGLPGETIELRHGRVLIDGRPLDEPYLAPEAALPGTGYGPTTVPDGAYFMMGDNRNHSADSRVWGVLPRSLIRGRATVVFFSFEEEQNAHLRTGWRAVVSMLRKLPAIPLRTRWSRLGSRIR